VVSPDGWVVGNIWFLLSTGQVAIGTCGSSLPVCAKQCDLLFSLSSSCAALQLQILVVSSSPQGGTVQFCEPSSVPPDYLSDPPYLHSGRLACCPHPTLSLCSSPCLCLLRIKLLALLLFSEFGSAFHPTPTVVDYNSLSMFLGFVGWVQSDHKLYWIIFL
jgi:hypothetical protein